MRGSEAGYTFMQKKQRRNPPPTPFQESRAVYFLPLPLPAGAASLSNRKVVVHLPQ